MKFNNLIDKYISNLSEGMDTPSNIATGLQTAETIQKIAKTTPAFKTSPMAQQADIVIKLGKAYLEKLRTSLTDAIKPTTGTVPTTPLK